MLREAEAALPRADPTPPRSRDGSHPLPGVRGSAGAARLRLGCGQSSAPVESIQGPGGVKSAGSASATFTSVDSAPGRRAPRNGGRIAPSGALGVPTMRPKVLAISIFAVLVISPRLPPTRSLLAEPRFPHGPRRRHLRGSPSRTTAHPTPRSSTTAPLRTTPCSVRWRPSLSPRPCYSWAAVSRPWPSGGDDNRPADHSACPGRARTQAADSVLQIRHRSAVISSAS